MESTLFASQEINYPKPLGYDKLTSELENLFLNKQLPPALLICGKEGVGKRTLVEYLAAYILNASESSYSNISMHPDSLIVETGENAKEITIDATRKIKNFLHLTPAQSENKVIIIDAVDQLNKNAANSILKVLEEPPANRYFLLVCHNKDNILDTINSRCQTIYLPNLSKNIFAKIIEAKEDLPINPDSFEAIYNIFPEQPGQAIKFLVTDGIEMLNKIKNISANYIEAKDFAAGYDFKNQDLFYNYFNIITYLAYQKFKGNQHNQEKTTEIANFIEEFCSNFRKCLRLNLDRKLLATNSLLQFCKI